MSGTSSTETQNIDVVRRIYEAFAIGDIETLKILFSAGANWNTARTGVLRGKYRGAQAIFEFFGQLAHETDGTLRAEPQMMAASGNHVFVLERTTGKRKGKTQDTETVLVFKLANGVVTEVSAFQSDPTSIAEFWSS